MSDTTKDPKSTPEDVKGAKKKPAPESAVLTRSEDADPTPGKAHVTVQGTTTIKTRW